MVATLPLAVQTTLAPAVSLRRALSIRFLSAARPVSAAYQRHIQEGRIRTDSNQQRVASRLDGLYRALQSTDARVVASDQLKTELLSDSRRSILEKVKHWMMSPFRTAQPRGLYIHGSVGTGKSFLMDLFYHHARDIAKSRKHRRAHFHQFMLDVHRRIHKYKQKHPRGDPIPPVATELAQEARLLCFDEFQVTDIANAMVLKRLLGYLLELGVVLVATSNRAPVDLYEGGLNRSVFLPFIDTLHDNLDVVEMEGNQDYRREGSTNNDALSPFFWPADSASIRDAIEAMFGAGGGTTRSETIPVAMGRSIHVPKANDAAALFDFVDLCQRPLGAADYIALCDRYPILIVENVPVLNSARFNEARRFVTLIDAMYETRTRLVMSSAVPFDQLFVDFDATVQSNDGDEETAIQGLPEPVINSPGSDRESFVKGEGGSSSSAATTMIRTKDGDVEWSATGRIGVSLAQLSAVKDVSFSFTRAESRLAEMRRPSWGRCAQ